MSVDLSTANPKFLACLPKSERPGAVDETRDGHGVNREIEELHGPIMAWCTSQVPAVPYVHADPTRASGINKGAPDFILFLRGKAILIECKTRLGKLSAEQIAYKLLCERQGIIYNVIRDYDAFLSLVV